jgi:hypothetical protein
MLQNLPAGVKASPIAADGSPIIPFAIPNKVGMPRVYITYILMIRASFVNNFYKTC